MTTTEIEDRLREMAQEVDREIRQIAADRFLAAAMKGDVHAEFPITTPDEQEKMRVAREAGTSRIAQFLKKELKPAQILEIAAKNIIATTHLARVAYANIGAKDHLKMQIKTKKMELQDKKYELQASRKTVMELPKKVRQQQAQKGGHSKNEPTRVARDYVIARWAEECPAYNGNRTAFSEHYVKIIANKFKNLNGDPIQIRARTIREVWLKNVPCAGI
jgi:hypothetical protein